ncbi:MAG: hypothetical protein HOW73_29730 [Polyangiaceae bacterium]|nr:hypothetical protein [Polyangiaceae bacterium]
MGMLFELAAAPARFDSIKPEEELVVDEELVAFFGTGNDARSSVVQGLRAPVSNIDSTIERVRAMVRARGRRAITWEVVFPTHTRALVGALMARGMLLSHPTHAVIMALTDAPAPTRFDDIRMTSVDTKEEFKVHVGVTHEVFDILDRLPRELARIDRFGDRDVADRAFVRYVARIGDDPVGASTATFTKAGVMLHSGCTRVAYRNRGVYSAMVAHRFHQAAARGTPALVVRAGAMSRPILQKLGFRELGEVHFLVDTLADA